MQARKIEEHRLKYERKRAEREIKKKQKRLNKAREEHAKAAAAGKQSQSAPNFGSGAAPGGGKGDFSIPPEMMDIFKDPEIQKCFEVKCCRCFIILYFHYFADYVR